MYSWYEHIRQTTTTCRNIESNRGLLRLTVYIMSSEFLPVVHRFCISGGIHEMCSVATAQSSSKFCRCYYLFSSSCFLVSLCCSAHAIVRFSHRVVISCIWPKYLMDLSHNILSYDFFEILSYVETTKR